MTVEELMETLRAMPPTARVLTRIRKNVSYDGQHEELYEFRTADIDGCLYTMGEAVIQLDE